MFDKSGSVQERLSIVEALQFIPSKVWFQLLCVYGIANIVWAVAAFVVLRGQEQKKKWKERVEVELRT